jgi:hypothetical protein
MAMEALRQLLDDGHQGANHGAMAIGIAGRASCGRVIELTGGTRAALCFVRAMIVVLSLTGVPTQVSNIAVCRQCRHFKPRCLRRGFVTICGARRLGSERGSPACIHSRCDFVISVANFLGPLEEGQAVGNLAILADQSHVQAQQARSNSQGSRHASSGVSSDSLHAAGLPHKGTTHGARCACHLRVPASKPAHTAPDTS